MPQLLTTRPTDATLSVTKAARLLGVHPNTVRAWSDQGRLRFYRINPRGDRRYRLGDLMRFLSAAAQGARSLDDGAETGSNEATAANQATGTSEAAPAPAVEAPGTAALPSGSADLAPPPPGAIPDDRRGRARDVETLASLAGLTLAQDDLARALERAVTTVLDAYGLAFVAAFERHGERLVPRASAGQTALALPQLAAVQGTVGRALTEGRAVRAGDDGRRWTPILPGHREEIAAPIAAAGRQWGALLAAADDRTTLDALEPRTFEAIARQVEAVLQFASDRDEAARRLHRAEALRRVANDITGELDLDRVLTGLVDHALVLFEADRAALFLRRNDGHLVDEVARGLSPAYLAAVRDLPMPSLPAAAIAARRPLHATAYVDDPRGAAVRAAVVQEGFDTVASLPLFDGRDLLGVLDVYHDRPRDWPPDEVDTMADFATVASVAIRTARNYAQMATWAAQLQSIQQLGARLNRLTSVREIGLAIASELRQLIDYHNVRVYRLEGEDLVPVALHGHLGEYVDETPEQLRIRIDQGITGWVARHAVAQSLPDAANDPRATTIPGTEEDLPESMLLAPMVFEDRVLGVLVLSKLGLDQFRDDDLRLLVIYASFAAQAMANADATERLREQSAALERQVRSQRDLLQITESILGTLEPRAVLDQIADRLGDLVRYDTISIEVYDRAANRLRPLAAKGVHIDEYLRDSQPADVGLAGWVIEHNEPQLVNDELADPRVVQFASIGPTEGSLIVVPLRGREGVTGVLTLERLGSADQFSETEFELVKLFAAHVSIALQNAETHRAVEIRARTDDLTGLLNHGTFQAWLARDVERGEPFSLIMVDLDDFKAVNDALGHQAGDRFLQDAGRAIVAAGRDSDDVFRYGGDEFVLLLPGTDGEGAAAVAARISAAIQALGVPGGRWHRAGLRVGASIGIASHPADGATADAVLLAADRACFVAKRSGRDRIATAAEGLAIAGEIALQAPTPVDPPSVVAGSPMTAPPA